jgi:hypothetical protein
VNSFGIKSSGKDDEYYNQMIKYYIFKEASLQTPKQKGLINQITIILLTEIQKKYPVSGTIEEYRTQATGITMKDNPLIEFVGVVNEDTIRITDRGINYWKENPNRDISESKLL